MIGKWQALKNRVDVVSQRLLKFLKMRSCPSISSESWSLLPPPSCNKKFIRSKVHWRLNRKAKFVITFVIVALITLSCFILLYKPGETSDVVIAPNNDNSTATPSPSSTPQASNVPPPNISDILGEINPLQPFPTTRSPGLIETSPNVNSTVWKQVAANAWAYFQPGVGVDPNTGLPYAGGSSFKAFTDWDLGVYIQSVIDAQKIGLLSSSGPWGSDARIDKVLTFLETRPLNTTTSNNWPFWFYNATDEQGYLTNTTYASDGVDGVDTGRLFVALYNLKMFNSSWTQRVNDFVYDSTPDGTNANRTNYNALLSMGIQSNANSNNIYSYYVMSGYARFFSSLSYIPNQILSNIINSPNVTSPYGNISLPDAPISCEPLLCSVFELNNNSELMSLMRQVYLAHEAYYNATGDYVAFSEGNSPNNGFVYEWVVAPNGMTWQITDESQTAYYNIPPIVYTKVAFSFMSLYNTTFADRMLIFLERALPVPAHGYSDGADNVGDLLGSVGSNTNGLILDAALYYLTNNPNN